MVVQYFLYLTSGLIRENDHALEEFGHQEGYSVLLRAMQSHVEKMQIKSSFLLTYICNRQPVVKGNANMRNVKDSEYFVCMEYTGRTTCYLPLLCTSSCW